VEIEAYVERMLRISALTIVLAVLVTLTGCAATVSRQELRADYAQDGTQPFPLRVNSLYYLGTKDGFHYFRQTIQDRPADADGVFHTSDHFYRVAVAELAIADPFPYGQFERAVELVDLGVPAGHAK
jgi:hypothetical protein